MTTEILERPEILAADEHAESLFRRAFVRTGLAGKHGWRRVKSWDRLPSCGTTCLFIVCTLEDLTRDRIAEIRKLKELKGRDKVFLLLKGGMPSRAVVDRMTWLDVRDDSRVHFAETDKKNEKGLAERLLVALDCGDDEHRIFDAWWEEETLVVVSPRRTGFKKIRVPLSRLPALKGHPKDALANFEIDEDGVFIYWPELDVHLGWEQFTAAVDQKAYLRAKQQSNAFNRSYGSAIRRLRTQSSLRQSDIDGLTARQIGRIERGECRATHAALTKLANAHRMTLSDYMSKLSILI